MSVNVKINGITYSGINSVKLPLADGSGYAQFDYADSSAGGGDSGGTETTGFSVTNNLTHVTNSNSASTVEQGGSYSATLTAAEGYVLESVTVTMGGVDITSTVYLDGSINIGTVSGDIVITATAVGEPIDVPLTKYNNHTITMYSDSGETAIFTGAYRGIIWLSDETFAEDKEITLTIISSGVINQSIYISYCNDNGASKTYYYGEKITVGNTTINQAGTHTVKTTAKAGYQFMLTGDANTITNLTSITATK